MSKRQRLSASGQYLTRGRIQSHRSDANSSRASDDSGKPESFSLHFPSREPILTFLWVVMDHYFTSVEQIRCAKAIRHNEV
jgi:hypothetical protein